MARDHVNHGEIVRFCQEKVNLPKDKADTYRAQADRLRDRLDTYIAEHPDFTLKKMRLSGSLAKGTALRSLNDIDVACYISVKDAPSDTRTLGTYLAERLRRLPNISPDQIKPQTYSVTVSYSGSGLDVDVVPILYDGDPNWYGDLVSQKDGSLLRTSITRHVQFAQKRKSASPTHFAQVVRLAKFWAKRKKDESEDFRFKSFMIELIMAHLADRGLDMSDYPTALRGFFDYIAQTGLTEKIVFADYYQSGTVGAFPHPMQIIDPVNAANNVSSLYTQRNVDLIVDAALEAGDAIEAALGAPTKGETVRYWQNVFGSSFNP
ncbi:CBASS oligonucleotide cyclase [Bosea sp. RAC05]|uniref:CBASS oligonucleotide cyclase n=1 Tax=Bosea sp. RAC05 TaxID=1842539 RepID=UPI00083E28BF|nr:CBASS oligonucleotide cyclase [Bosea sp. RAC05]AOG03881.1 nucleotidyltransferase domain protein [Bosea sp. RAC05]